MRLEEEEEEEGAVRVVKALIPAVTVEEVVLSAALVCPAALPLISTACDMCAST
jgi:hypothetical protein